MHADAATVGDEDVAVVQRVCEVGQAGIGSRTGRVDFGRTLHGERLVWPFGIEFLNKRACCCRLFIPGGRVASFFSVRCMRSWRPFCCGWPGLMRSMAMPRRSHHTESLERLKRAFGLANGTPLSDRIAWGSPRSWKSCSKAVMARFSRVDSRASQSRR